MPGCGHGTNTYLETVLWEIHAKYAMGTRPLIAIEKEVWEDKPKAVPGPPPDDKWHTWSGDVTGFNSTTAWDDFKAELENAERTALQRWISDYMKDPRDPIEPTPASMGKICYRIFGAKAKQKITKNVLANDKLPWDP